MGTSKKKTPPLTDPKRGLKAMNRFLNEFRHMGHDHLLPDPDHVDDFLAVRDQLITDDLPRYEKRFRERLVENVAQEIGLFRSKLDNAAGEIERKIELLKILAFEFRVAERDLASE